MYIFNMKIYHFINKNNNNAKRYILSTIIKRNFSSQKHSIPTSIDAVVVGGGSLGTSCLYHLQKLGINTILLEKDKLTAGTTWHSAGMLWRLRPSDIDIELHAYTREMCKQLEIETDENTFSENGGLFIACNKERQTEYIRLHETGKYYGIESTILKPHDIVDIHPLINVDDVIGGIYSPGDGTIDPTGIVNAYAKGAKKLGGQIFENVSVCDITTETSMLNPNRKQIQSITTSNGDIINCNMIVNACGAWSNSIANMADVELPLLSMKHAYVVTESLPGMNPSLPNVRDHDLSIYLKTQGDAMAIGGYETNPEFHHVDSSFSFGLYDLDWDTFGQNLSGHVQRCPSINTVGIKSTVCGPESFTPDHKPLVGPVKGIDGYYNCNGFNSMGMMLGGGIGKELALWMKTGSPSLDLFSFDSMRFHPDCVQNKKWVKDRTHESYAKTYSIIFPHDEPLAGRNIRKSALHEELIKNGCVHQSRHGYERPGWFTSLENNNNNNDNNNNNETSNYHQHACKSYDYYGAYEGDNELFRLIGNSNDHYEQEVHDSGIKAHKEHLYLNHIEGECTFNWPNAHTLIKEECHAVRNSVAIFDQSYFGKFYLSGKDALKSLQYICSANMDLKCGKKGQVVYTTLCNYNGGVEADLTVTNCGNDTFYIAAGGNTMTKDYDWIDKHLYAFCHNNTSNDGGKNMMSTNTPNIDLKLVDRSNDMTMISIQGPYSRKVLELCCNNEDDNNINSTFSNETFPFTTMRFINFQGIESPVMCLRLTFVGETGFELHVENKDAKTIYDLIKTRGANHGIKDAGYRSIDSLSAEKNYRHWHSDLSNKDTPMEAGIGFTASMDVNFIGRDALLKRHKNGLQRKLICLTLNDGTIPLHGVETIWREDVCMGIVKSTAFGHTIGKSIVYGYVDLDTLRNTNQMRPEKITKKWLKNGNWFVGSNEVKYSATFVDGASYDPKNEKILYNNVDYEMDKYTMKFWGGLSMDTIRTMDKSTMLFWSGVILVSLDRILCLQILVF